MFSRLWRSNQIILCVMSGGSLEKLTRAVTYWQYICFLRFRGFFFGVFQVFLGVFRVFLGCSWFFWGCSGFFGCSGMFRCSGVPCSGVPCSGVPGSTTCPFTLSKVLTWKWCCCHGYLALFLATLFPGSPFSASIGRQREAGKIEPGNEVAFLEATCRLVTSLAEQRAKL